MKQDNLASTKQPLMDRLQQWFLWFWVKRWRVTFLFMFLLVVIGLFSVNSIPKESTPDIEFGIIGINTVWVGVNPLDIDNLITTEIEQEIKDIEGIKKITSTSRQWFSNITVELETDVDTNDILVDIQDAVDKASLPSDAEDPSVIELSSANELVFQAYLYAPADLYGQEYMTQQAQILQNAIENQDAVSRVDIVWGDEYEVRVLVEKESAERIGISLAQIAQSLRSFNANQPLGNYELGEFAYDYRIQGEYENLQDILDTPLAVGNQTISLGSIATLQKDYLNETHQALGFASGVDNQEYSYIALSVNKAAWINIFTSANQAREAIQETLAQRSFDDFGVVYANDLADNISEDYRSLSSNGLTTIVLVFLCMLFFVGAKESVIASISIPLAFFVTFFVLDLMGLSLNFLTNFSLIITFGIAIDTTIVIIEWAHEKIRMGYNPRAAVLLAVRDYRRPVIAGTSTTLVVFLPLLTLPDVLGKFLAYIPITIFLTLLASLFISLTINSALYLKLSWRKKDYESSPEEPFLEDEEKELLAQQRSTKTEKKENIWRRERFLDGIGQRYSELLGRVVANQYSRMIAIFVPLALLILSFVTISGNLWFELFPSGDSTTVNISMEAPAGTVDDVTMTYVPEIRDVLSDVLEVKYYTIDVSWDTISARLELFKKDERRKYCGIRYNAMRSLWRDISPCMRLSDEVEKQVADGLSFLSERWVDVAVSVQAWWPPAWAAVWVKLVAQENSQLETLIEVSKDFEDYLESLPGSKNVANSSESTPGQFVFSYDRMVLQALGLTPQSFQTQLFASLQWLWAGDITINDKTADIVVTYRGSDENVSPQDVQDVSIPTQQGNVRFGDVSRYVAQDAIASIQREDTDIVIQVTSATQDGITPDKLQWPLNDFAASYDYPVGIGFAQGGETAENADLISSLGLAFAIALILIYMILVLQFNSYLQPLFIMYSVIMALLWVNLGLWLIAWWQALWLWLLKVPYSLAFMIGFIALTGIVVNDAIVFIDRINRNKKRWMEIDDAIKDAWRARLQPIILTTITTVLGLSSVATQDEFFAGLAFTIMFGLFIASTMTLFVVPALYRDTPNFMMVIKRAVFAPFVFIFALLVVVGLLVIVWLLFGVYIRQMAWFMPLVWLLWLIALLWYTIAIPSRRSSTGQTLIQQLLWLKTVRPDGSLLSYGQAWERLWMMWLFFIGFGVWVLIIVAIIMAIFGISVWSFVGPIVGGVSFLFLIAHLFSVWSSDHYETLHDRITKTRVIAVEREED